MHRPGTSCMPTPRVRCSGYNVRCLRAEHHSRRYNERVRPVRAAWHAWVQLPFANGNSGTDYKAKESFSNVPVRSTPMFLADLFLPLTSSASPHSLKFVTISSMGMPSSERA
ncbi:hypothetical protein EI94DRAFT_316287 [Lactarius quietus]|nr:hypothetical protein EI94DRAFT_316287 [Lactarius quietus]